MKFKTIVALLLVMLIAFAAGCGMKSGDEAKSVNLSDVKASLDGTIGETYDMQADGVLTQYGIAAEDCAQMVCCFMPVTVFNDEFLMFEGKDSAAADAIAEKLQNHYDSLEAQANDYDPDMAALLEDCKVQRNGNYVALFISLKAPDCQTIWDGFMK